MNFAEMSWKEIQEGLKKTQTILVPLSPLEQHGFHLPVSTDYFRAFELCKITAEKAKVFCTPAIIAGTLKKGYAFPGGISTSPEALKLFVRDIIKSLIFTGFKKIIIVSGHGGTTHNLAIREIVSKFSQAEYYVAHELIPEKILKETIESENDWHSGEHETSEMLYLAPELVEMRKAVEEHPNFPEKISSPKEYMKANPSGVNGNPLKATKAKGKKLFNAAVQGLIEKINTI